MTKTTYELFIYNPRIAFSDLQQLIFEACQYNFTTIASPLGFSSHLTAHQTSFAVAATIGFPFGTSSLKSKLQEIIEADDVGVDIIDFTLNQYDVFNANWKNIISELKALLFLNKTYKKRLRLVIDFNLYNNENLIALAKICDKVGIREIITSVGLNIDDYLDNLVISAQLKKFGLTPIFTMYNHHKGHIIDLETAGITNIRLTNLTRMNSISI